MSILELTECVGIASAALSGFLFGVKKGCDWLGIFIAAFLTALGGGIMRDTLVSREIYSFTHYAPVTIVLAVSAVAIFAKLYENRDLEGKFLFILTDAIDVVSFSIVGAMVALSYNHNVFGVVLIAFCNGVGGGILRDVLLNEVPWFLRTGLYGTISMSVGLIYFVLDGLGLSGAFSVIILLVLGVAFRMVAYYKSWHLPKVEYKQ